MAISGATFTTAGTTGVSSLASSSLTWVQGRLYIIWSTVYRSATNPSIPTFTSATYQGSNVESSNQARISVFTLIGDGSTGIKTLDCGGVTHDTVQFIISEYQGTDVTNNGTGAVVQLVSGSGTSTNPSMTMNSFLDPINNGVTAMWASSAAMTPEAGFIALNTQTVAFSLFDEYRVGEDTTPGITMANAAWFGMAMELKWGLSTIIVPNAGVIWPQYNKTPLTVTGRTGMLYPRPRITDRGPTGG